MAGSRLNTLFRRCTALLIALSISPLGASLAADRPHIVYVLADDLGFKDVGFHGGKHPTPQLDKLAAGGVVLNSLYGQPYSSQTRAALLTGRYPMRYGLQTMSILPGSGYGLPSTERTLAQALKEVGYKTALIGKWQLGHAKPEFWPTKRGFDYFYGSLSGNVDAELKKAAKSDWRRNDQSVTDEGSVTSLLARDAVAQIERHDFGTPLFMLLSLTTPADAARRGAYGNGVAALDDAVGQLVAALTKKQVLDKTLLIVHSDNGGAVPMKFATGDGDVDKAGADNDLYREGKGSLYEGGVRVVALAHWPGRIKEKSIVATLMHVTDMHATLLKLAGARSDAAKKLDGVDVWASISEGQASPRREMLVNVEDFRGAMRIGEWKLIVRASLPSRIELFNVSSDPEESSNQADAYPERVKEMLGKLNAFAYEMADAKYLEELAKNKNDMPVDWGHNVPKR